MSSILSSDERSDHSDSPSTMKTDKAAGDVLEIRLVPNADLEGADGPCGRRASAKEVDYQSMNLLQTVAVMIAETISLGALSLPYTIAHLGYVIGTIFMVITGVTAYFTGYNVYLFIITHTHVYSFADALSKVFGLGGRIFGEAIQFLMLNFIMAAHVLTWSVMLNTLSDHGVCTILFKVTGTAICLVFTLPRTLKTSSWWSIASCLSITSVLFTAMISAGIHRHDNAISYAIPPGGMTSIASASEAISSIVLAFSGHIAYPSIISEMRRPEQFPTALRISQTITACFYLTIAIVMYHFVGQNVESPALSSLSPLMRKVCYGLAIPTIVVAGVIPALISAKNIYKQFWRWRGRPKVTMEKSTRALVSWYIIVVLSWITAWMVAEAIPNFFTLLALIGAALGSWYCLGMPAMLRLYMCMETCGKVPAGPCPRARAFWQAVRSNPMVAIINVGFFVVCCAVCALGIYGCVVEFENTEGAYRPFSCQNNSK